jgi:RNA polymerase sigma-70 factor (sigma-E family)
MSTRDHVATSVPGTLLAAPGLPTARAGAREEFGELVAVYHQRLARLAYLLCGNRQQAEDAVADAYAKVWPRYRRGSVDDVQAYLRQAVVNQIRGGFRRRIVERREEQRQIIDLRHAEPEEGVVDARESLSPAIEALPAAQRAVIVLRYYEDLSEDETARLLGISVGTVKSRSSRGLQRLRVLMGDDR